MKRFMLILVMDGNQFVVFSNDRQELMTERADAEFSIGKYERKKCFAEMYEYRNYDGYVRIY